jgi:hypothetical protein
MKIIDAKEFRDYFYYGKNEQPIITQEIDAKIIEAIDACTREIPYIEAK